MASTYPENESGVKSRPVTGKFLSFNHRNRVERAFVAVDLFLGAKRLTDPTMVQSAWLARVNATYAWWAYGRLADRVLLELGVLPFGPPKSAVAQPTNGAVPVTTLAPEVDAGLVELVRTVGVDKVLNAAIAAEATH
jgi:hypothetical protein